MGYRDDVARIAAAKTNLIMRKSPGASPDARTIARQQGAKTSKQVETQAKLIHQNRINDAQKSLTRAKMQGSTAKLMRSVNPPTFKPPKTNAKAAAKKAAPKATTKAKPMTEAQKQAKALDALQAKRAAVAKKTGVRPNYRTN